MGRRRIEARIAPVIAGTVDEVLPIARAHANQFAAGLDVEEAAGKVASQMKGFEEFALGKGDRRERRAALFRIAARAVVLLALDELERGPRAAASDAKALDEFGTVLRPVRVRTGSTRSGT